MKKLLLLFLLLPMLAISQQNVYFNKRYVINNDVSTAWSIVVVDSGFVAIGHGYDSVNPNDVGIALQRVEAGGTGSWSKVYTFPGNHLVQGMPASAVNTSDGGYALAGSRGYSLQNYDVMLWRFKANGDTLWTRSYGGALFEDGSACRQTADGGFILMARKQVSATDVSDIWLIRTDSLGNILWERTYGGALEDFPQRLETTSDGGFFIGSTTRSFGSGTRTESWAIKTDSLGNIEWQRISNSPQNDCPPSPLELSDGSFLLFWCEGEAPFGNNTLYRAAITKVDSSGSDVWNRRYMNRRLSNSLAHPNQNPDGSIIALLGTILSFNAPFRNWSFKFTSQGDSLWRREYTYPLIPPVNQMTHLRLLPDGGFVIAGWVADPAAQDMWVLRADSCGYTHGIGNQPQALFTIVNSATNNYQFQNQSQESCRYTWSFDDGNTATALSPQHSSPGPGTYTVHLIACAADRCDTTQQVITITGTGELLQHTAQLQLYPNPASEQVQVRYLLPYGLPAATLQLTDLSGRVVLEQVLSFTSKELSLQVRQLPNGLYFYRLSGTGLAGKLVVGR